MGAVREAVCALVGCDRAPRVGYDHCARCGTSYWHVARAHGAPSPFRPQLDPVSDLRRLVHFPLIAHPLTMLGDLEGSELFVDEAAA